MSDYRGFEALCWVVIVLGFLAGGTVLAYTYLDLPLPKASPGAESPLDNPMTLPLLVLGLTAWAAAIPARIAANKGHGPFLGWWFYGWVLWPIALIHAWVFLQPVPTKVYAEDARQLGR